MNREIVFDRSLYLPAAVDAAAAAYADYAQVEIRHGADTTIAVLSGVEEDELELVANAFSNHVLYETITRIRHASGAEVG